MFDFLDKLDDELKDLWKGSHTKDDSTQWSQGSSNTHPPKTPAPKHVEQTASDTHKQVVTSDLIEITSVSNSKDAEPVKAPAVFKKSAHTKKAPLWKGSSNQRGPRKHSQSRDNWYKREKFVSTFPETKFYLPSLRDKYTRYIPIGWNNETGAKNMWMFQYGDDLLLVDCGVMFADETLPWVDYSIPDVSFLTKYTKNIKGFVITHAHLDHIGALKHIVPALDFPTLYGTKLTLWIVKKGLTEAGFMDKCSFVEVDAKVENHNQIGHFDVEFFSINHSIPDSAGLFITSPGWAKFFHTGDFKIDVTPAIDQPADFERFKRFGDKGVTMLLSDSTGSIKKGSTQSEKPIGEELDKIVAWHNTGRLFIATFSSWISRVQQLIDSCEKHGKFIFLSGRSMIENVSIAKELGYLRMKEWTMKKMTPKTTQGVPPEKQVIITTWSQWEEFSALTRMAQGLHPSIEIVKGDTIVFSSSVVPGNDRSVWGIINKLIALGANVITKDNANVHTGWHGAIDDQKKIIELVRPKYFTPVYWDIYFRSLHAKTAQSMWIKKDKVLLLDNGNIIDFAPNENVFRSKIKVPLQDIVIDGNGMWTANSHVISARHKMKWWWVLVVNYRVDRRTKALLGHIRLETRGLVYIDEVRNMHREILKKCRFIYENTIQDIPDMEEKDLLKIVRTDLEKFISYKVNREPMIIPMITYV